MKIRLFVNHYCAGFLDRQEEIDYCLRRNLNLPVLDEVVAICEPGHPYQHGFSHVKLKWIERPARPRYTDFIEVVNSIASSTDISIIANSDIYFDDSLRALFQIDMDKTALALSRWDRQYDGTFSRIEKENSQDSWILQGAIQYLGDCGFRMGTFNCDNRFACLLQDAGYRVANPCDHVRSFHVHASGIRNWGVPVKGEHLMVPPCSIFDLKPYTRKNNKKKPGLVSFSLFGNHEIYNAGAIQNMLAAAQFYPGWTCRFYVDDTVDPLVIAELRQLGAEIVPMPRSVGTGGMFWRMLAAEDCGYERWIVRDLDSRFSHRERKAVDEWIESGLSFHILRDHPNHALIPGGLFGGVNGVLMDIREKIAQWIKNTATPIYGSDQDFLAQEIYPLMKGNVLEHDSFASQYSTSVRPFPTPMKDYGFVGERFDANNNCNQSDHDILVDAFGQKFNRSEQIDQ